MLPDRTHLSFTNVAPQNVQITAPGSIDESTAATVLVSFADVGSLDSHTVTIQWAPLNASDEERKTFDTNREGMTMGWTGTFDQLAEYLKKA